MPLQAVVQQILARLPLCSLHRADVLNLFAYNLLMRLIYCGSSGTLRKSCQLNENSSLRLRPTPSPPYATLSRCSPAPQTVLLESDPTRTSTDQISDQTNVLTADQTALVDALQAEVQFLREELQRRKEVHTEENRRKDTIIAQLTQRIPELEPVVHPRDASETSTEGGVHGEPDLRATGATRAAFVAI